MTTNQQHSAWPDIRQAKRNSARKGLTEEEAKQKALQKNYNHMNQKEKDRKPRLP